MDRRNLRTPLNSQDDVILLIFLFAFQILRLFFFPSYKLIRFRNRNVEDGLILNIFTYDKQ